MGKSILLQNCTLVNEGKIQQTDVLVQDGVIQQIGILTNHTADRVINGTGQFLLPGIIDGQVHFRDPGLTHKGDIHSESRAAVAGGVTSYIDMPNTKPNVLSLEILQEKYRIAAEKSLANFGFFLGTKV